MVDRPNILWICTDQQRYDTIASLGNPGIRTPNIDRLVRQGVSFTRAYAQSPVCTPSRASFLTGRYPRTTRCRQNGQTIPADERLISRILADAGYTCGLAGKLHLSSCSDGKVEQRIDDGYSTFHWSHHPPSDWGDAGAYTRWLQDKGKTFEQLYQGPCHGYVKEGVPAEFHQTTWCAEMAIDFIREQSNSEGPWLFNFNCFDPHHPFDPPPEYLRRYDPADMPLPSYRPGELEGKPVFQREDHGASRDGLFTYDWRIMTEADHRQVRAAYHAMCELIDDQVGRMIAALDETGQRDNTLIVFMSDHGEMLGDHGLYLKGPHFYEQAVRVPLVLSWPGQLAADRRVDGLVELVDLAPTLLDIAGLAVPAGMQGRSLAQACEPGSDGAVDRQSVLCEYYNAWTHAAAYATMWRTHRHKIVVYHGMEAGELYDLENDPDEFDNLWSRSEHVDLRRQLTKACFDASVFTLDPMPPRRGLF